jgi:hypothetical protein
MEQVREFLRHASECLAMATKANNPRIKADLEALAKKWQDLADQRQKFLQSPGQSRRH